VSLSPQTELLRGTLDLLILQSLQLGPLHGLGVARHRLEERGWLRSEWGSSENNRRAKFYRLTRTGKARLKVEVENWSRIAVAITRSLREAT
jgi:DNA-binding PadR family transcriptional regulator